MRTSPKAAARLGMLVEEQVPGENYVNAHAVDVRASTEVVWQILPDLPGALRGVPASVAAVPLVVAAAFRGDLRARRPARAPRRIEIREGARIADRLSDASIVIARVDEGREVVVTGRHRFADFALNVFLQPLGPARTRVHNVTRARFRGGALGRIYRAGVDVFHDRYVEWGLGALKHLAEERARSA